MEVIVAVNPPVVSRLNYHYVIKALHIQGFRFVLCKAKQIHGKTFSIIENVEQIYSQ